MMAEVFMNGWSEKCSLLLRHRVIVMRRMRGSSKAVRSEE